MANSLLEALLGEELVNRGFSLEEDENCTYLSHNGKLVGTFNSTYITMEQLRREAWDYYLFERKEV